MHFNDNNTTRLIRLRRGTLAALGAVALLALPSLLAQTQQHPKIAPTIPQADRHEPGKVFL